MANLCEHFGYTMTFVIEPFLYEISRQLLDHTTGGITISCSGCEDKSIQVYCKGDTIYQPIKDGCYFDDGILMRTYEFSEEAFAEHPIESEKFTSIFIEGMFSLYVSYGKVYLLLTRSDMTEHDLETLIECGLLPKIKESLELYECKLAVSINSTHINSNLIKLTMDSILPYVSYLRCSTLQSVEVVSSCDLSKLETFVIGSSVYLGSSTEGKIAKIVNNYKLSDDCVIILRYFPRVDSGSVLPRLFKDVKEIGRPIQINIQHCGVNYLYSNDKIKATFFTNDANLSAQKHRNNIPYLNLADEIEINYLIMRDQHGVVHPFSDCNGVRNPYLDEKIKKVTFVLGDRKLVFELNEFCKSKSARSFSNK